MSEPALVGFPSNPSVDDEYDGWRWDGDKWVQIELPAFEIDDAHLLKKAEDNIVPSTFAIHVDGGAMFKPNSIGWDDVTELRYTGVETTGTVIANAFVGDGSALTNLPVQIPDSYTKSESDAKYQLIGDYALNGASYTKSESDGKYQLIGDYALNGVSYTKAESDAAFQPLGNYAPDGNYALVGASYTKTESDGKYQLQGNYALVGASYTKAESDNKWQPKGSYQPAGNYALVGASYTKAEADSNFQPKGSYALTTYSYSKSESDNKYQGKGSYATTSYAYSKAESDAKYELKGAGGGGDFVPLSGNSTISGTLTANDFVASSDVRLKTNITRAPQGMLAGITGKEWDWKETGQKSAGVIAQELEAAGLGHLVHEDEKGFKAVAYNGLIGYLISEVNQLRSELEDLKQ